jgi:predicted dehydrogenase
MIRDGDIHIPKVPAQEPLKEQVSAFLRCCETGERPLTDATAGRRVVAVLEAATESLRAGGTPVEVARPRVAS